MNLTIVIPVHQFDDDVKNRLELALISVEDQDEVKERPKVLIVHASTIEKELSDFVSNIKTKLKIELVKNQGKTDFQSQVNLGVEKVETEYFSILEFDDEVGKTYLKQAKIYTESYPEVGIFLWTIVEVNGNNPSQVLKLTNEVVWSRQFVGENGTMGELEGKGLDQYSDFKICGALIKKEVFDSVGGLKTNIDLTFVYEFLLRVANNGYRIFTIPKIGYKHSIMRDGSLFSKYDATMPMNERKFWFDVAKKESHFINDRVIDKSSLTPAQ